MLNESENVSTSEEGAKPNAKPTKEIWRKIKEEYQAGRYKSQRELAERFGVNHNTLGRKISLQKWKKQTENKLTRIEEKIENEVVSESKEWIERVKKRLKKEWDIVDRSVDNIGSEVDPDTLLGFSRVRKLQDDMVRRALGLRDEVDVTTGGKSIGESFLTVLEKLRGKPALTDEELERIVDVEIVE